MARCFHQHLRCYEFWCEGWTYLAIECRDCPVSTSMPISNPEGNHWSTCDVAEHQRGVIRTPIFSGQSQRSAQ